MKGKRLALALLIMVLLASAAFAGSGRTIQGRILKNDSTAAVNATVVVHTHLLFGACNCSTPISSVSFTDSNGDYVESSSNLIFDHDCPDRGYNQGDSCDGIWFNNDYLWVVVDGGSVVPVPQDNKTSNMTATWATQYTGDPIYADVINLTVPPITTDTPPGAVLNYPVNGKYNDTSDPVLIIFNCSAMDTHGLTNISLYITNPQNTSFSLNSTKPLTGTANSTTWTLFLPNGNYTWNCLVYDTAGYSDWGNSNFSLKINFTMPDNPPAWSNVAQSVVAMYSPLTQSSLNVTWTDYHGLDRILLESNFSGIARNYSMSAVGGGIYRFAQVLPAGSHFWRSYANDTANQWNSTSIYTFTIAKASAAITLSANVSAVIINGTSSNVSCRADSAEVNVTLFRGGTWVGTSRGGTVSDIQSLSPGNYLYQCNVTSTQNYTSGYSSIWLNVSDSSKIIGVPQCSDDNATYSACGSMAYGDTITHIRVNCTTPLAPGARMSFRLRNQQDATNYIDASNATSHVGDFWIYNADYLLLDSGNWILNATCYDTLGNSYAAASQWTLPWGILNPAQLDPVSDIDVQVNESFNITTQATCVGGECGTVDASLHYTDGASYTTDPTIGTCLQMRGNDICQNIWAIVATAPAGTNWTFHSEYNSTSYPSYIAGNSSPGFVVSIYAPTQVGASAYIHPPVLGWGRNVSLLLNITDIGDIDDCWAYIDYPNASTTTIGDVCYMKRFTAPYLSGAYNVTFYANDTHGDIPVNLSGSFKVGQPIDWFSYVVDENLTGINSTLEVYYVDSEILVDFHSNGTFHEDLAEFVYDLLFKAYDDTIWVKLKGVNVSLDNNKTLGLDKIPGYGDYLVVFSVYNGGFTFTSAEVAIFYNGLSYTDEDNMRLEACEDWNFTARTCPAWTELTALAHDKTTNRMNFTRLSFSAFGIREIVCGNSVVESGEGCDDGNLLTGDGCDSNCQTESSSTPSGGGGGGGCSHCRFCGDAVCYGAENCSNCPFDCGSCPVSPLDIKEVTKVTPVRVIERVVEEMPVREIIEEKPALREEIAIEKQPIIPPTVEEVEPVPGPGYLSKMLKVPEGSRSVLSLIAAMMALMLLSLTLVLLVKRSVKGDAVISYSAYMGLKRAGKLDRFAGKYYMTVHEHKRLPAELKDDVVPLSVSPSEIDSAIEGYLKSSIRVIAVGEEEVRPAMRKYVSHRDIGRDLAALLKVGASCYITRHSLEEHVPDSKRRLIRQRTEKVRADKYYVIELLKLIKAREAEAAEKEEPAIEESTGSLKIEIRAKPSLPVQVYEEGAQAEEGISEEISEETSEGTTKAAPTMRPLVRREPRRLADMLLNGSQWLGRIIRVRPSGKPKSGRALLERERKPRKPSFLSWAGLRLEPYGQRKPKRR